MFSESGGIVLWQDSGSYTECMLFLAIKHSVGSDFVRIFLMHCSIGGIELVVAVLAMVDIPLRSSREAHI